MSNRLRRLAPAAICFAALAFGQAPASEEEIWKSFLAWLDAQPPNSKPVELIRSYRAHLDREGVPGGQASRRMGVVSQFIFMRRKGVELLWNKVYAGNDPIFSRAPNELLVGAVEGRQAGKALDVGMGQGRTRSFWRSRAGTSQASIRRRKEFVSRGPTPRKSA